MHTTFKLLAAASFASLALTGCLVVPEPVEEPVVQAPVVVEVPEVPLCYEVSQLERVEIPAVTKKVTGISLIENPPYEPIEQRTTQEIVIKQAEVYYALIDPATGNQREVTNLCDPSVPVGNIGPAPGEAIGTPTTG